MVLLGRWEVLRDSKDQVMYEVSLGTFVTHGPEITERAPGLITKIIFPLWNAILEQMTDSCCNCILVGFSCPCVGFSSGCCCPYLV